MDVHALSLLDYLPILVTWDRKIKCRSRGSFESGILIDALQYLFISPCLFYLAICVQKDTYIWNILIFSYLYFLVIFALILFQHFYISIVLFQQPKLNANLLANVKTIPVHTLTGSLTWIFFWIISSHCLMYQIHKTNTHMLNNKRLGEGNLMFYCICSQEIYFGLIGWQNNNNNLKSQGWHI